MKTDYDYHILGMLGKKIGNGIPVFTGLPKHISKEALRNLGAQLNTSGAYAMYHIVGFTPEAPTIETAFGGNVPKRKVVITNEDMSAILDEISLEGNRQIDFAMFGCPHFTLDEVKYIAEKVDGQKLKKEMWILTSSHVKEMAVRMGFDDIVSQAGGFIVSLTKFMSIFALTQIPLSISEGILTILVIKSIASYGNIEIPSLKRLMKEA